jgi:hypothetical protein
MSEILERARRSMERDIAAAKARFAEVEAAEAAKPPAVFTSRSGMEVFEENGKFRIRVAHNGYVNYEIYDNLAEAKADIRHLDREAAAERRWERRVS